MNMLSYTVAGYEITIRRNLITRFLSGMRRATSATSRRVEFLSIYGKLLKRAADIFHFFFRFPSLGVSARELSRIWFTSHRGPHRFPVYAGGLLARARARDLKSASE